jgi:hypothetical protein
MFPEPYFDDFLATLDGSVSVYMFTKVHESRACVISPQASLIHQVGDACDHFSSLLCGTVQYLASKNMLLVPCHSLPFGVMPFVACFYISYLFACRGTHERMYIMSLYMSFFNANNIAISLWCS